MLFYITNNLTHNKMSDGKVKNPLANKPLTDKPKSGQLYDLNKLTKPKTSSNQSSNSNEPSKKTIEGKLEDQDNVLADALRTLNETEEIGADNLNKLYENKDKIKNAKKQSTEVSGNTDSAGRSLSNMKKRSGFMGFIDGLNPFSK